MFAGLLAGDIPRTGLWIDGGHRAGKTTVLCALAHTADLGGLNALTADATTLSRLGRPDALGSAWGESLVGSQLILLDDVDLLDMPARRLALNVLQGRFVMRRPVVVTTTLNPSAFAYQLGTAMARLISALAGAHLHIRGADAAVMFA